MFSGHLPMIVFWTILIVDLLTPLDSWFFDPKFQSDRGEHILHDGVLSFGLQSRCIDAPWCNIHKASARAYKKRSHDTWAMRWVTAWRWTSSPRSDFWCFCIKLGVSDPLDVRGTQFLAEHGCTCLLGFIMGNFGGMKFPRIYNWALPLYTPVNL